MKISAKFLFTLEGGKFGRKEQHHGNHTRKTRCGKGGTESHGKAKPETRAHAGPEARQLPEGGPRLRKKRPETAMEDILQGLAPSAPVRPGAGMNAGVFPQAHCRRRCWFAQGNVCRCACGGENHGAVRPNGKSPDTKSPGRKKSNGKNPNGKNPNGKNPNWKPSATPQRRSRLGEREFQMLLWSADTSLQEDSSPAATRTPGVAAVPQRRTAWPSF